MYKKGLDFYVMSHNFKGRRFGAEFQRWLRWLSGKMGTWRVRNRGEKPGVAIKPCFSADSPGSLEKQGSSRLGRRACSLRGEHPFQHGSFSPFPPTLQMVIGGLCSRNVKKKKKGRRRKSGWVGYLGIWCLSSGVKPEIPEM